MSLSRAIATVGALTAASRVLGFIRDMMVAAALGAGPVADAFFVAFKFPNFFRRLFGEGAFNSAFVPMFAGMVAGDGKQAAIRFAEQTLAVLLGTLLAFTLLAEAAMPWLMAVLAPGFEAGSQRYELAVELTRITFPYLLFVSISALLSGVLNSLDRYAAAAATPILLNLCMILAIVSLPPVVATMGHALAWGVMAAGVSQFVWLTASCIRAGAPIGLPWPHLTPQVRRMLKLMVPGAIGAGITQVNLMVDVIIASLLPAGSVSFLYYADRINQLPLGVVGAAVGTALLPILSKQLRAGDVAAAQESQNRALEYALLLTLPATAGLVALAQPIITVLFQRGAFSASDALATGGALAAFSVGLPAYVLIKVLTPGFFARHDTATPVKVAVGALVLNVVFSFALMPFLAHIGVALATALSAWVNFVALAIIQRRRAMFALDDRMRRRGPRLFLASIVMGGAMAVAAHYAAPWLDAGSFWRYVALPVIVAAGILLYFGFGQAIGAMDLREAMQVLRRRRRA